MVHDLKPREVFQRCAEFTSGTAQLLWAKPAGNSWYGAPRVDLLIARSHLSVCKATMDAAMVFMLVRFKSEIIQPASAL